VRAAALSRETIVLQIKLMTIQAKSKLHGRERTWLDVRAFRCRSIRYACQRVNWFRSEDDKKLSLPIVLTQSLTQRPLPKRRSVSITLMDNRHCAPSPPAAISSQTASDTPQPASDCLIIGIACLKIGTAVPKTVSDTSKKSLPGVANRFRVGLMTH
jgi:hypothetical protein